MPIQLDSPGLLAPAASKAQTPKFFDKIITGSGKSSGVINDRLRPGRYPVGEGSHTMPVERVRSRAKTTVAGVMNLFLPLGILCDYSITESVAEGIRIHLPVQDPDDGLNLTEGLSLGYSASLFLTPQGLTLKEDSNGDSTVRQTRVLYRMEVLVVRDGAAVPGKAPVRDPRDIPRAMGPHDPYMVVGYSFAPLDDAPKLIAEAVGPMGAQLPLDLDAMAEWMAEYDVHERICALAEQWSGEDIADIVCDHISDLFANGMPSVPVLNRLATQLRYLETYSVSLDAYRRIHATINAVCPPDAATTLSKQNMNLLMSHTLEELSSLKSQLPVPPTGTALDPSFSHFSSQQINAVTTEEPLVLVQAGAGTGKSTVILARIAHLVASGVDPSEITVLSFTNAAADHIREKNPLVNSMTIARMIHDIYSLNFPKHELSSVDTILNSLDIFYPDHDVARAFRVRLLEMEKKAPGATTGLNAFIEYYRDQVIEILDTIGQTCLELEIILAYQMIDTMVEPPHVSSRYLVIDEVQDNSVFEFIYALKYTAKHRENLFLVGDCSQTLYEFRASNPKALNALESSGVFATFQLTTNYRSNQSILDFANRSLMDIEANQYAQIQLRANSLAAETAKEFTQKVRLDYRECRVREFRENLAAYIRNIVGPYIDERLALGEQVAFLAYDRASVSIIEKQLQAMYPGREVANLVSAKAYSTTVFSEFIKAHWSEVRQVPSLAQAAFAVTKGIDNHLDTLVRGDSAKARPAIMGMVSKWWMENGNSVNAQAAMAARGIISDEEFFEGLRQNLLDFEIAHNAVKQSLLNQRNKEKKEASLAAGARLVVSTIHGAKGLEFDNVVVIHKFDPAMDEAAKRMFYVAFTRAMNTEFILSYGSSKKPKIEADYQLIVSDLLHKERLAALAATGVDPAVMAEDEVEAALAHLEQRAREAYEKGEADAAASILPGPVDYSTRGADLPKAGSSGDRPVGEAADDGSAFTS